MIEKEFISNWIEKVRQELKTFPDQFVKTDNCEVIKLPGKLLFLPPPLFGSYQITDDAGETIFSTDDHFKAKYVMYGNRNKPMELKIPRIDLNVYEAVRDYERHIDTFLKEMEKDFKEAFPKSRGLKNSFTQVFGSLNITRY
jgi:hypothetical protein